jgi:mRNA-degrading endonuclease toxin of MazEF toxin-antitoxin module
VPDGSEAGFTRPVLVVQDDSFNESGIRTIVVVPLTTNLRLAEAPGNVFIGKKESRLPMRWTGISSGKNNQDWAGNHDPGGNRYKTGSWDGVM